MFKFASALISSRLGGTLDCLGAPYWQCVRWRRRPHIRKPIWLGTAKSKLLKFPQWHPFAPGEYEELAKLYQDYKHNMKSICQHFREELEKTSKTSQIAAEKLKEEEQEHVRLLELNRQENERVALLRDARVADEILKRQERLARSLAAEEERRRQQLLEAEELVRKTKEMVKTFVTLDMLDEAIDRAMETEVDYNFAIDLEGNYYHGLANSSEVTKASGN